MSTQKLLLTVDKHVARITFNNPEKHNALSMEMWQGMRTALEELEADSVVRVLILRGTGGKAFASGADVSEFEKRRSTTEDIEAYNALVADGSDRLADFPKPPLALLHGYCMGGGLGIAAACDLRFASPGARFALPAAKLGVGYRYSALKRLFDLVGRAHAADIFYTGRQWSVDEALANGLVNKVLPHEELEPFVADYANRVAANAPLSLASVKRAFVDFSKEPHDRDPDTCREFERRCSESRDYVEGRTAFREKRAPVFTGT